MAQLRPDQPPPTPTPQPPAKQPNTRLRLALLLAGVAIYILFLATPLLGRVMGGSSRLDVPYSVLKAQAADNNIKDLTLQGQQATGDFNTAVSYQGVSNTAFTSTTPEPGADPSLYTLLDQNHVSYSVKEATGGWTGLLICLSPVGCVAASNLFSALGQDYHAGPGAVALAAGPSSGLANALGSLLGGFVSYLLGFRPQEAAFSGGGWVMSIIGAMVAIAVGLAAFFRLKRWL